MNKRDIVIGSVVILALAGILYFRQSQKEEDVVVPETLSVEDQIEEKFKYDIPDNVEKAELKDVSGGDSSAIATKDYSENKFSSTFLADLPDLEAGYFYQGWISKGEEGKENYQMLSLGKLIIAKGGWMLDYSSSKDYSDFEKVIITKEKVFDSTPETTILEGSF